MLHEPNGPQAGNEEDDFWTDIPEGNDMLSAAMPIGVEDSATTLASMGGLARPVGADPMYPAILPNLPGPFTQGDGLGTGAGTAEREPGKVDPLGSWTGVPADEDETPTQDADDL